MTKSLYEKHWPPTLTKNLVYPEVPLFRLIQTAADYYPTKTALNFYGGELDYKTLHQSINSLAGALKRRGVGTGERVAVYMQNCPHYIVSFFGIMRANAVVVPINPMWRSAELTFLLEDSGATALITTAELLTNVEKIKDKFELKTIIAGDYIDYLPETPALNVPDFMMNSRPIVEKNDIERWIKVIDEYALPPAIEVKTDDLCLLPYTSGSTGMPKGCLHTHETVMSNLVSSYHWLSMTPSSAHLSVLPYFHVTGLIHGVLAPLYAGATLVVLTRWDRNAALDAIEKFKCTHWISITAMVVDLLSAPDVAERDLSSLLLTGGGGAPLPKAVGERLKEITGLVYTEGYGLTETISQTHFNPPHRPKLQCIGIPDFGINARIIDVETKQELPPNMQGELVVNGPEVFKGYWNRPEDTREAFMEINGKRFFRTGDICYMDEEGYFYIVDRTKRMINAAGFKIWPAEVESCLYKHPDVLEACVVGVPHPKRGEEARAYVVLKPGSAGKVQPEEIRAWCKEQMAAYKYPRQIVFADSLPKSGTGKILWRELQEQALKEFNK